KPAAGGRSRRIPNVTSFCHPERSPPQAGEVEGSLMSPHSVILSEARRRRAKSKDPYVTSFCHPERSPPQVGEVEGSPMSPHSVILSEARRRRAKSKDP